MITLCFAVRFIIVRSLTILNTLYIGGFGKGEMPCQIYGQHLRMVLC